MVLHHLAIVYRTGFIFYYVEPAYNDLLAYLVLAIFIAINQAYFIGLLFLISGYFSPQSLDCKGPRRFVRDRLIRLGIPLVVFYFVLNPIASLSFDFREPSLIHITTPLTWQDYPKLAGFGPIWFIATLLIFDIGYVIWWAARGNRVPRQERSDEAPRYRAIAAFILLLAVTTYLIRIIIPINRFVAGFPTISYLPQYLSFFVLGTVAVRHNWFRNIPKSMGKMGFILALVATITPFPLAILSGSTNFFSSRSAVSGLCSVGFDRCGGNGPRTDRSLP